METLHALISGKVQGVGFRFHTQLKAKELNIVGWVRNLKDGRVEVVAKGPNEPLDTFLSWLHKGPSHAIVDGVELEFIKDSLKTESFEISLNGGHPWQSNDL